MEIEASSTQVHLEGSVEGRQVEIDITYERFSIRAEATQPVQQSDPLALDLDGNGLHTTGVERGVAFDINADGVVDQTSVVAGGDAFVALDRNRNGRIDNGAELFGDQLGDENGFLALGRYDDNQDGVIDSRDGVFDDLRLLRFSERGQKLSSLREEGVLSISLGYRNVSQAINTYDRVAQSGAFTREDNKKGLAADLVLGYRLTPRQ